MIRFLKGLFRNSALDLKPHTVEEWAIFLNCDGLAFELHAESELSDYDGSPVLTGEYCARIIDLNDRTSEYRPLVSGKTPALALANAYADFDKFEAMMDSFHNAKVEPFAAIRLPDDKESP